MKRVGDSNRRVDTVELCGDARGAGEMKDAAARMRGGPTLVSPGADEGN